MIEVSSKTIECAIFCKTTKIFLTKPLIKQPNKAAQFRQNFPHLNHSQLKHLHPKLLFFQKRTHLLNSKADLGGRTDLSQAILPQQIPKSFSKVKLKID
jgi:hypothetical protein